MEGISLAMIILLSTLANEFVSPTEAYGSGDFRHMKSTRNGHQETKGDDEKQTKTEEKLDTSSTEKPTNVHSAIEKGEREGVPSNILEKGIIYFFFRGRVGIDDPSSVDDLQRSYIVLRPIEKDAKLSEGTIGDAANSRLIAVPK